VVAMAKQDKKSRSWISGIVLFVQFLMALFRAFLMSLWHRERMNKKLASQAAEKKLHEIVSSDRERIMKLLEKGEHWFITKEGEEYLAVFSEGPESKIIYITYFTKSGEKTNAWVPEDGFLHQVKIEASYDEDEDATKKLIRIGVSVDEGGGRAVCRREYLNADDFSIYEWPL